MQKLLKTLKSVNLFMGLFFLGLSLNLQAATLTIYSVDGVSAYDDETESTPIVYGAFSPACNTLSGNDPSTGCANNPITSSSTFEICAYHDDSNNTAEFTLVTATSDGDEVSLTQIQNNVVAGDNACITALWSSICTVLDSDNSTCGSYDSDDLYLLATFNDENKSTLSVNIDFKINAYDTEAEANISSSECTGTVTDKPCVFNFSLVPGDGKAILMAVDENTEAISANSGFPSATNHLTTKYIRFYYATGSTASFDPGTAIAAGNFQDIEIITDSSGNSTTATDYITGLDNDQEYTFRVATVDEAGNIGYFLDETSSNNITNKTVTPEKVYGVFEESRCFIATAAYGNPLEKHLVLLREFRDKVLKKYQWGKKFIHFYYSYSPRAAVWLLDKEVVKPIVRVVLWPLYFFAKLSLKYGMLFSLMLSLAFVASVARLLFYFRQRMFS